MNHTIPSHPTVYRVITGCVKSTRGRTLAALTREACKDILAERGLEQQIQVEVQGVGIRYDEQGKIGLKPGDEGRFVSEGYLESLRRASESVDDYVNRAADSLATVPSTAAEPEQLRSADVVYAVDNYTLAQYARQAGESDQIGSKYQTVLDGAGKTHSAWASKNKEWNLEAEIGMTLPSNELDDVSVTKEFECRVIVPKIQGKQPAPLALKDTHFYALNGTEYTHGDPSSEDHMARDLAEVSYNLAEHIIDDAQGKAQNVYETTGSNSESAATT